jgi:hypothetical protein
MAYLKTLSKGKRTAIQYEYCFKALKALDSLMLFKNVSLDPEFVFIAYGLCK